MIFPAVIALLQTTPAPSNPALQMLTFLVIPVIFYFLFIRPMQKQKKEQKALMSNLESGLKVLTSGGIVGTIVEVREDTVILRVKPQDTKLEFAKLSVTGVIPEGEAGK